MEQNRLWPGGPIYRTGPGVFPLSTDSILLADFAAGIRAKHILDLGCGGGILTLLLSLTHPGADLAGVELSPEAAERCRENLTVNGLDAGGIVTGDLRDHRSVWRHGSFDLVISNPPYFPERRGHPAPDAARGKTRDERDCTLDELCAAAAYLCRFGGAFALVHRPERLSEVFCTLTAHGLEPKRLRLVQHRGADAPSLALVEARRGGGPGLTVEKPLILHDDHGGDSPELRRIYHMGGGKGA